jgi:hypothetical protein
MENNRVNNKLVYKKKIIVQKINILLMIIIIIKIKRIIKICTYKLIIFKILIHKLEINLQVNLYYTKIFIFIYKIIYI